MLSPPASQMTNKGRCKKRSSDISESSRSNPQSPPLLSSSLPGACLWPRWLLGARLCASSHPQQARHAPRATQLCFSLPASAQQQELVKSKATPKVRNNIGPKALKHHQSTRQTRHPTTNLNYPQWPQACNKHEISQPAARAFAPKQLKSQATASRKCSKATPSSVQALRQGAQLPPSIPPHSLKPPLPLSYVPLSAPEQPIWQRTSRRLKTLADTAAASRHMSRAKYSCVKSGPINLLSRTLSRCFRDPMFCFRGLWFL